MGRPCKTAILSTGGGSRGLISFGMLKAIVDLKIEFDTIYAGSVGALNALLFIQDQMDELENLWMTIQNKDVYSFNPLNLWRLITNDASIYSSKPLEKLIRKYLDIDKVKSYPKPIIVNVTNLTTMQTIAKDIRTLDYEECVKWILASASPPILFPTITYNTDELCDTGILNNYFINQSINDGHDRLICLTPTTVKPKPIRNLIDIVQATISTSSFGYLDRERKAVEKINSVIDQANVELTNDIRKIELIVIKPPVPMDLGLIDFNYKISRTELIRYGYQLAYDQLAKGGI